MYEDEEQVLCAASAYDKKFYMNPRFSNLPEQIQQELQIMCVLFTEDVGGILILKFAEDGTLQLETHAKEDDFFYDDIGSVLKIHEIQRTKRELLEELEMYYRVLFLGDAE